MKVENINGKKFKDLALYSFAGFGLEILIMSIEQMIYGNTFIQWTSIQRSTHLILTSAIWGSIIYLLLSISKNKYNFNCWDCNERSNIKSWVVVGIIGIVSIIITTILWGGLKPIKEFYSNGIVIWLFQNVYYLFEVGLILLTIVFGQRYGEIKFVKSNIAYGGLFLSVTWGLVHILTQGFATGIYAFVMSIIYGVIYILLNKNIKFSYLIIAIIFIL